MYPWRSPVHFRLKRMCGTLYNESTVTLGPLSLTFSEFIHRNRYSIPPLSKTKTKFHEALLHVPDLYEVASQAPLPLVLRIALVMAEDQNPDLVWGEPRRPKRPFSTPFSCRESEIARSGSLVTTSKTTYRLEIYKPRGLDINQPSGRAWHCPIFHGGRRNPPHTSRTKDGLHARG